MSDLLTGESQQLCMGWAATTNDHVPLMGVDEAKATDIDQALFFRVACNAGSFIVKASDEFWISFNLIDGLKASANRVSHDATVPIQQPSLQEVLGLDDIDDSTITSELVEGPLADYYRAISMPLVTYMGRVASTSEA